MNETEEEFQATIIEAAHLYGWTVAHFRGAWSKDGKRFVTPVQADGKGFPDLVLVKEGEITNQLIFAEVKSSTGKLSIEQTLWKNLLEKTLAEYYLWRPDDWEKVIERLKR